MLKQLRFSKLIHDLDIHRMALQLGRMSEEETQHTKKIVQYIEFDLAENYGFCNTPFTSKSSP